MFKKAILAATIVTGLGMATAQAASTGTINFRGSIVADTCDIAATEVNQNIDFGAMEASDFPTAGTIAGRKPITIQLTDCQPGLATATLTFSGNAAPGAPDLLANTGDATGVAIGFYNADDSALPLDTESEPVPVQNGSATLSATAALVSTADTVGVGSISGIATFKTTVN